MPKDHEGSVNMEHIIWFLQCRLQHHGTLHQQTPELYFVNSFVFNKTLKKILWRKK